MADKSRIEWTDSTWTPIRARRKDTGKVGVHCERVSPACKNCYAATFNKRNLPVHGTGLDFIVPNRELVDVFVDEKMLHQPLRWRRGRRIFVCSQTDLFGEFVTDKQIDRVFAVMALAPQHTFQVVTKRPERMRSYLGSGERHTPIIVAMFAGWGVDAAALRWPLPNVWLGVTAENQEWADKRIPLLLQTPAAKRFVSVEPMLGPVDLQNLPSISGIGRYLDALQRFEDGSGIGFLHQVICGGESGHGARPMHPDWARSLRDQCQAAGVPFFFKQWGEWAPYEEKEANGLLVPCSGDKTALAIVEGADAIGPKWLWPAGSDVAWQRVGKRAAGRLLDGREWNEFPEADNAGA